MFSKWQLVVGSLVIFGLAFALQATGWRGPNSYTHAFMDFARPFICLVGYFAGAGFGVASFFHHEDEGGILSKLLAIAGIALNGFALAKIITLVSRA